MKPLARLFSSCSLSVILLIVYSLMLSACGGSSSPTSNRSATSGSSASSKLTISANLPAAVTGQAYDSTLGVGGGTPPYVFSLASGQLPSGVNLGQKNGTISGTPQTSGDSNFEVKVFDSTGLSGSSSLKMSVMSPPPPPTPVASNPPASTPPASNTPASNTPSNPPASSAPASSDPPPSGNSFSSLQSSSGWASYGQQAPDYVDCSPSPCEGITFSMTQDITSPSMSGHSTQFNLGGTAVYSDALFNNHLIGQLSSQGMPDQSKVSNYHDFTYDVYFYGDNLDLSEGLEFDVNQFFDSMGFIFGHQCRIANGNEWDVWDNVNTKWVPTGISCYPKSNTWNHVTIVMERTSDNHLEYKSITLNGSTSTMNSYYPAGSSSQGWNGITINFQMDGNYQQSPYAVYLDNLTFSYN